ncbi:hypothetical protein [Halorhabdus rudnickae]|uniref:hypothetical protein n=1 Tax=Halorhabdus rudnickae TaxID=1775544 RepID=UPI00108332C7|nr:hypothetical protein [Halorhabdus rudnickae]
MTEKTWFDSTFDEHLLLRDMVLVVVLVFGFGIPMGAFLEFGFRWGIASGVVFAALFLAVMESLARRNGESMFRYFLGGDPLAKE